MKIIKFKQKRSYSYKRKILIKDLVLKMLVGIHNFEKKKKQRVRFNIEVLLNSNAFPNDNNLNSIVNYENIIINIKNTKLEHINVEEKIPQLINIAIFFSCSDLTEASPCAVFCCACFGLYCVCFGVSLCQKEYSANFSEIESRISYISPEDSVVTSFCLNGLKFSIPLK